MISQTLSAVFVLYFLTRKSELKVRFVRKDEISECAGYAKNIVSLGTAGFIMQLTNSLVTICCNNVLSVTGGDIYISVMTIVSSVRQLVETPIYAMNEGTSPILSYNYGARRPVPRAQGDVCHECDDPRLYRSDVERDCSGAACADRYFQFGCGTDRRCGSGSEAVLCSIHFHGSAVHWTDRIQISE